MKHTKESELKIKSSGHREERNLMEIVNTAKHYCKIRGGRVNQQNSGYKGNVCLDMVYPTKTLLNQNQNAKGLRVKPVL